MRYMVAVEGHRDFAPYYMDMDEEFLAQHPEIVLKMGEILGLFLKYGGEIIEE